MGTHLIVIGNLIRVKLNRNNHWRVPFTLCVKKIYTVYIYVFVYVCGIPCVQYFETVLKNGVIYSVCK